MKIFKNITKLIFTFCFLFSFSMVSHAAEEGIGFEVRPFFSTTQIDPNLGYYYIQTEPGTKQTFELSVLSTSDKEKTLEIVMQNAISTPNGSIGYSDDLKAIGPSLKNPISEIVKPQKSEIILKPREETIVTFEINPPETAYDGLKMGQIIIKEKVDESDKGIKQAYQYGLGIITAESGDRFNTGNQLELEEVKATIVNGGKVITGEITTPDPKTIENLKVRSYVTKKGDSKKLKEKNIDHFSFSPNSKVAYEIPWGLTNFESGDYTFHFEAQNDFDSFNLVKNFQIRANDAKNLNNEAAFKVGTPQYIKILLSVMNGLLLLLFILILLRNNKWKKEIKEKRNKKGNKRKKGKR